MKEWPDPDFIAETKAAFPDKAIANVEEARVLYETGYTYLDVRPALELEEAGKVRESVNVPFMNAKWKYNAEERKKEMVRTPNDKFLEQMRKKFPNKDQPLLVGCSDGRKYSIDALRALDAEGYTNLVALRGGFYAWFRVFDNKLNRRYEGEYSQVYGAAGDSCGIHSSGAGFEKMDAMDPWVPRF